MSFRITSVAALLFLGVVVARGQDGNPVDEMRALFADIASQYEVAGGGRDAKPFELHPQPVLNWNNPERRTDVGAMFFWTQEGRPQAAMCIYPSGPSHLEYEFQSISDKRIRASAGGGPIWEPTRPGVDFLPLESSQPVSESRQVRTRQLRGLARGFQVALKPKGKPTQSLRMLATPVYRYAEPKEDKRAWIDGAVFTFVQGTDPEALLLLEAVRDGEKLRWQYAMARMTVVPVVAHRDSELVWKSEPFPPNRYSPYFVIRRVERDDAEIIVFE